jgi:hypothetical protein
MYLNSPNMEPEEYFETMEIINKKRYDALRAFFIEKRTAQEVAKGYGYTQSSLPVCQDAAFRKRKNSSFR